MKTSFDRYTFSARILPAAIVLLPAGFAVAAWFPDRFDGWLLLGSLAATGGLAMLIGQLGRDAGKTKQAALWQHWGGAPAVQLFRHRDGRLDPHTLARYHTKMKLLMPSVRVPTARTEATNPDAADQVYQTWVNQLREATRDKVKFNILYAENISYGFRRNLWGMKPAGVFIAIIGVLAVVARVAWSLWQKESITPIAGAVCIVNVTLLVLWVLHYTRRWVRLAADAYAERLLAACDILQVPAPSANLSPALEKP